MLPKDDKQILLELTLPVDAAPTMKLTVYKYPESLGTYVHTEDFVANERNEWYESPTLALIRAAAWVECSKNFEHFTLKETHGYQFGLKTWHFLDELIDTSSVGYETRFEEVVKMKGLPTKDFFDALFKNVAFIEVGGYDVFFQSTEYSTGRRDEKWWVIPAYDDEEPYEWTDDLLYQEDGLYEDLIYWEDNQPPLFLHSGDFIDGRLTNAMIDGREHWQYTKPTNDQHDITGPWSR